MPHLHLFVLTLSMYYSPKCLLLLSIHRFTVDILADFWYNIGVEKVKRCSKCKEKKLVDEFSRDKTKISGLSSQCKKCRNEARKTYYKEHKKDLLNYAKKYYQDNKIEKLKYRKLYYEENKGTALAKKKQYYEINKTEIILKRQQYRKENPETIKETRKKSYQKNKAKYRENNKKWRKANPEKVKEINKRWHKNNPKQSKKLRKIVDANRAARIKNTGGRLTSKDIKIIEDRAGDKCEYCHKELKQSEYDHIIPLCGRGINKEINIAKTCIKCNRGKGGKNNMGLLEWEAIRDDIILSKEIKDRYYKAKQHSLEFDALLVVNN